MANVRLRKSLKIGVHEKSEQNIVCSTFSDLMCTCLKEASLFIYYILQETFLQSERT